MRITRYLVLMIIITVLFIFFGCATTKPTPPQKLNHEGFQWGCLAALLNVDGRVKTKEQTTQIAVWCEMLEKQFRRQNNIIEEKSE